MLYSAVYRILGVLQYSLWAKVIRALHDSEGGFDHNGCKFKGIWSRIVDSSNYLHSSSILPSDFIRFQVGCGSLTRFCKDIWLGNSPLYTRFNRLFRLDQEKNYRIVDRIVDRQWSWNWSCNTLGVRNIAYLNNLLLEISELDINEATDKCVWSLAHDGAFFVAALRRRIDDHILPSLDIKTTGDKTIPRKVNIFMWRLKLDRLPHRLNLSSRAKFVLKGSKMTTLAEHIIVVGTENRPPMLEKSMYDSWASRIRLFIKGKKNGRMMLDSIGNDPLVYPTIEENEQTRPKKYSELTEAQQLQDDCDVQETNIILHGLPPDVYELDDNALAKSLYTTNYDQLYAYLSQHKRHANEVRIMRERYLDPLALVANSQTLYNPSQSPQHLVTLQSQAEFPQLDFSLAVPTFQQGDDPIECINKAMAFLSTVASRRVTVQQVQGRQTQSFAGTRNRGIATTSRGNYTAGQAKIIKCYNYLGEGHMAKQCTQPNRPRTDPRIAKVQVAQQIIPQNLAFQTEDLDAYDSDCDDISLAKAVLMENLSSCDPDALSEVPYSDSYPNDMINLDVQEMPYSEQTHIGDYPDNKIKSDSNIIPYSQYLQESQDRILIHNRNAKLAAFQQEIDTLKETLSNHVKEKESLSKTLTVFKTESKEKESKYIDKEIVLEKQNKEPENIISLGYHHPFNLKKAQRIKPTLYDGSVIAKEHAVIFVIDDEETLILEEESRSKMLDKQKIMHIAANSVNIPDVKKSCVNECNKCLELDTELPKKKDLIEKDDTVIRKLKDRIKSLSGKDNGENLKKDIDEIETINIELEHSVTKLLSENKNLRKEREHLKSIYKDQFDSIRKTHVQSKEHSASLIAQINAKSVEYSDLNAQLQEKVFAIAALKNELRKLKGKNVFDTAVSKSIATISLGMFKLDIEPISHRLKNNRDAHEVYLEKTRENTETLRRFVECARKQNPSEPLLESSCIFTKHVQKLLVYVSKTCLSLKKPSEKLVAVTPMNKDKKFRSKTDVRVAKTSHEVLQSPRQYT
ncbi:hypothetical protein Tco_0992427 [Tanacetum coccineum]|uniref:Reverse transcriptase zinc-binding domain-containing protein n=1 Tax=Tanacetum coccineum TaxID=301880 RepID=A0ABQ5F236_9ASTR